MMRVGKLRHRLNIQTAQESVDAVGAPTRTWFTVAQRWGFVQPLTGREFEDAQRITGRTTHAIKIRDFPSLLSEQRIEYDSRAFNIVEILNKEERDCTNTVLCEEVNAT